MKKKKRRQRRLKRIFGGVLAAALIVGGVFFVRSRADRTDGKPKAAAEAAPTPITGDIPLGGVVYDRELEELTLDAMPEEDWENLLVFPRLRKLTVNTCDNPAAVAALREKGVELHYNVALDGRKISSRTPVLTVKAADAAELSAALALLPELKTLRFENCTLSDSEKSALREQFPQVLFLWDISIGQNTYQSTAAALRMENGVSAAELKEKLPLFPLLRDVDISACAYSLDEINDLRASLSNLHFIWSVEVLGRTVSSDDKELDLSGIQMTDTAAVEAALPALPNLEKVIMSDCGFSNEEMDALNNKYDDVRFVWTVYFGTFHLRTDATAFIAAKYDNWVMLHDGDCVCLKYCTDLEALDLGHMAVKDLSFVNYMPHLKYLIIVEAYIEDISPLANCPELKYLELFKCPIVDLSPLLTVKTLEDLNICYIWIPTDLAFEQLSQMTWLDRLWFCGTWFTEQQKQALQDLMPDCEMDMRWGAESTGGTWRKHEHYYEMRDAFDMYYMPGGTNGLVDGEWVVIPG